MKPVKMGLAWAAGLAAGALAWAAGTSPSPDSYAKVDAASLVNSPQSSWARAILFSDVMEQVPAGRPERLDRKNFLPMKLKTAGTVWVPEALAAKFQVLKMGDTYSFAGTVDQISRRYYVIVDACYAVQTAENMSERWTDMLNPPAKSEASARADVSETAMQALLLEAQNSLIKLAAENKTTVAQLIEKQTDGGQRIAEEIVASALHGELKAQNKTAEELMIGQVLALLQKQAVLEESQKIAEENAALPPAQPEQPLPAPPESAAVETAAVVEKVETAPVEQPAVEPPVPAPEAALEEPSAVPREEAVPETPVEAPLAAEVEPEAMAAVESVPAPTPEVPVEVPMAAEATPMPEAVVLDETDMLPMPEMPAEVPATDESAPVALEIAAEETAPLPEGSAVETTAVETPEPAAGDQSEVAAKTDDEKPKKKAKSRKKNADSAEPTVDDAVGVEAAIEPPAGDEPAVLPDSQTPEEEALAETIELLPGPTVDEEIEASRAAELIAPSEAWPLGEPTAPPPSSMLVVPLSGQPEMVPMVSVEPTKEELARIKKMEAVAQRERERAERKAAE